MLSLPENKRDAANLKDHLPVWNVIFKKLEKCFCFDQLGSTQMPWEEKKWDVTDAVGHYSSKDSFQTQVCWAPKEKTTPKSFFFSIQK